MLSGVMLNVAMLSVVVLNVIVLNVVMLSVAVLNVVLLNVIMLSVAVLNVVMLSVAVLNVILLNVVMVDVVMLNVVAPSNSAVGPGRKIRKRERERNKYNLPRSNDDAHFYYIDSLTLSVDVFDFNVDSGSVENKRRLFRFEKNDVKGFPGINVIKLFKIRNIRMFVLS
jgi:hypothetical protein